MQPCTFCCPIILEQQLAGKFPCAMVGLNGCSSSTTVPGSRFCEKCIDKTLVNSKPSRRLTTSGGLRPAAVIAYGTGTAETEVTTAIGQPIAKSKTTKIKTAKIKNETQNDSISANSDESEMWELGATNCKEPDHVRAAIQTGDLARLLQNLGGSTSSEAQPTVQESAIKRNRNRHGRSQRVNAGQRMKHKTKILVDYYGGGTTNSSANIALDALGAVVETEVEILDGPGAL
eukprot:SAG31_NODE_935_length_10892_cov_7.109886_7_plen_232_part_00